MRLHPLVWLIASVPAAGRAQAQGAGSGAAKVALAPDAPSPPDAYQGVVPGVRDDLPWPPPADGVLVTYPGFQVLPGGASRLFVQLTAAPAWKVVQEAARQVVVEIEGARIHRHNNQRWIVTRAFPTRVAAFRARPARKRGKQRAVQVIVRLSEDTDPGRVIVGERQHGRYHYLFLDVPAPTVATPPPPFPTAPSEAFPAAGPDEAAGGLPEIEGPDTPESEEPLPPGVDPEVPPP